MKDGFTIVELVISIAIFGLLATAAFAALRQGTPGNELHLQASNLTSLIREAQIDAQSGVPWAGSFPLGGYGINIATCTIAPCHAILFADQNTNFDYEPPAETVEDVTLGPRVIITAVSVASPARVLFRPPAGAICIGTDCSAATPLTITLGVVGSTVTQIVTVNPLSGQVSS